LSITEAIHCRYAGQCGGCSEILVPYSEQISRKKQYIESLFENRFSIKIHTVKPGYLRDRCDLSLFRQEGRLVLGLYDMQRQKILDLEECPQMSPALWKAVERLRQDLPDIDLGSIRVRVNPSGKIGLWLDFPNETVKRLLDAKDWLQRILKWAYIEIGQKRKKLVFEGDKYKLLEDEYEVWFETYTTKEFKPFPLYGKVGGFTQPGFEANKKLLQVIQSMLPTETLNILELCSGMGNFSFFLASLGHQVHAVEMDESSIEAMKLSLAKSKDKNKIKVQQMNLHSKNPEVKNIFVDKDLVLADPPRSGLGQSLNFLSEQDHLPKYFLYISCFPESFLEDTKKLENLGYRVLRMEGVDQFPQSKHLEVIALLERK
jgi:23S rRNA (uracil1939-C5)-methyltransferase